MGINVPSALILHFTAAQNVTSPALYLLTLVIDCSYRDVPYRALMKWGSFAVIENTRASIIPVGQKWPDRGGTVRDVVSI